LTTTQSVKNYFLQKFSKKFVFQNLGSKGVKSFADLSEIIVNNLNSNPSKNVFLSE
jgi:hypothetical protein